ncbi:MAG: winged helix-turn-helix transcriptional regulator [Piscinibacter sp.]|uniref:ArsR/SmtB family transcription factor n=1 Tax=Piscinibacter sp. TaxID=1903157 RepID=UPI002588FE2E|nr:metalloregulator ArsR/SmtB family transcription factor [Piscinibacter sp.]MCW5667683.1 winged helix-turn-helix transcriptional regulator [Piscinibacter sp.]
MSDATNGNGARDEADEVFESAAELFGLLSTPIRLKLLSALCHGERNVSELLAQIDTTQPNLSQHLATLYRAQILARRREGTQIYYRIANQKAVTLCRAVCTQMAMEMAGAADLPDDERLLPARRGPANA